MLMAIVKICSQSYITFSDIDIYFAYKEILTQTHLRNKSHLPPKFYQFVPRILLA